MKKEVMLTLPVMATIVNLFLAVVFVGIDHQSHAQSVTHSISSSGGAAAPIDATLLEAQQCVDSNGNTNDCRHAPPTVNTASPVTDQLSESVLRDLAETMENKEEGRDPMLRRMPTFNVSAYVRADVSTFYGEEPGTREEFVPEFEGQAGKFVNLSPERVTLYWNPDNGNDWDLTANIRPWSSGGTACHPQHKFVMTRADQPDEVLCHFTITPGTSVYYCDPYTPNDLSNPAKGEYVGEELRTLSDLSEQDQAQYRAHMVNLEFAYQYKWFTGGSEWLSMYPRDPPRHKIWRADRFGQEHVVTTQETHFLAEPPEDVMRTLSVKEMRGSDRSDNTRLSQYRVPGTMNMTIRAVSCAPRAFEIDNFLSDVEVDHILDVVAAKNDLERSGTGSGSDNHISSTRTSRTTWVPRHTDPILNAVFRRVADALRLDEALLRTREAGEHDDDYPETKAALSEDLQIVHYAKGQQYTAHHDFGFPKAGQANSPSRSINLCMYLNDVPEGGQTSFVRWRNGHTSSSLDVTPKKGKAMIFFMLNPDGNLDDLTQHAALPVVQGEKWFANLWIHDPIRL
jgi:prolyl 4-hydroxylase